MDEGIKVNLKTSLIDFGSLDKHELSNDIGFSVKHGDIEICFNPVMETKQLSIKIYDKAAKIFDETFKLAQLKTVLTKNNKKIESTEEPTKPSSRKTKRK